MYAVGRVVAIMLMLAMAMPVLVVGKCSNKLEMVDCAFDVLDLDQDGYLSADEIEIAKATYTHNALERMMVAKAKFLEWCDLDGDGALEYEEALENESCDADTWLCDIGMERLGC
jgi:Ca2+-binding EF-hand superfamily protein